MMYSFYATIKTLDAFDYVRFLFVTGNNNFSWGGVLSELDILYDTSINPAFRTMYGFSSDEIDTYFAPYIKVISEKDSIE
jgi:hypothetical protein